MKTLPNILLTGSSGFLGSIIQKELEKKVSVCTLGRSQSSTIQADLTLSPPQLDKQYEYVIHNAGKAHFIPDTKFEAKIFDEVNVKGTKNLLLSLENLPPRLVILISSVSVYGRDEGTEIEEIEPLNGSTPYAKSKIKAEELVQNWCEKHGLKWLILRLPLVVGPNPPGNLGALIDRIRKGRYIRILGNQARKSMVLGSDVAQFIARNEPVTGIYNLTDGNHPMFSDLEDQLSDTLNVQIRYSLPHTLVSSLAKVGDICKIIGMPTPMHTDRFSKMTNSLTFSDQKARRVLGWRPRPVLDHLTQVLSIENRQS